MIVFLTIVLVAIAGVAYAQTVYPFPDVNASNEPHVDAIAWAADHGIVEGYVNGNFGPADNILRQQAASMFMRYDTYLRSTLDGGAMAGSCADCHDSSQLIPGYQAAWSESLHATGDAFVRGTSAGCAGCHSGGGFQEMIAASMSPDEVTEGDMNPTPINCRTCHQVHENGTGADWALETTDPVTLFAFTDVTFDGGKGNLCANCHQPRRAIDGESPVDDQGTPDVTTDDTRQVTSTHWGPHHGPQSAALLGVGGSIAGDESPHYGAVENTCVTCHLVDPQSHTFEPKEEACQSCHAGVDGFDVNGVQTTVKAKLLVLENLLETAGYLVEPDPAPATDIGWDAEIVDAVVDVDKPAAEVEALWNWIYVAVEDSSFGVHNPDYIIDLLDAGIDALAGV